MLLIGGRYDGCIWVNFALLAMGSLGHINCITGTIAFRATCWFVRELLIDKSYETMKLIVLLKGKMQIGHG